MGRHSAAKAHPELPAALREVPPEADRDRAEVGVRVRLRGAGACCPDQAVVARFSQERLNAVLGKRLEHVWVLHAVLGLHRRDAATLEMALHLDVSRSLYTGAIFPESDAPCGRA